MPSIPPSRVLVIYFSRTGTTRRAAEMLAQASGAELCAITEKRSRLGPWGYARCLWQAALGLSPPLKPLGCEPASADCVFIGTPIWGWHLSSPVRSFARRYQGQLGRIAFFCTQGGSGSDAAFGELQRILGRPPLATLALTDAEMEDGRAAARIEAFARLVKGAAPLAGAVAGASRPLGTPARRRA